MAYMNQTKKQTIASKVKPILAKYGMKGSLSVRNHSTIVLKLTAGPIDFIGDMATQREVGYFKQELDKDELRKRYNLDVNPYWFHEHYTGEALAFLSEIIPAMKGADWYDRSDIQTDYFDTAYYYDVNVGSWQKPYTLTK
jgi:hypothetical protein